jgi:SAM-dependent methyltransferase
MMDSQYYKYYDKIYSTKDYRKEVNTILGIVNESSNRFPKRLLDIGCGTGTHSLIFAEMGCDVVGIDNDCEIIEIARSKCNHNMPKKPKFYCKAVSKLKAGEFDLAVALFNVVNYVDTMELLLDFFSSIHKQLSDQGLFIFDCWNGLAALLDPPRPKISQFVVGNEKIEITTQPYSEIMNQSVTVDNHVNVTNRDGSSCNFNFRYHHTLWTPWCLNNILRITGFEALNVSAFMKPSIKASHKTWKIMFVCKKLSIR